MTDFRKYLVRRRAKKEKVRSYSQRSNTDGWVCRQVHFCSTKEQYQQFNRTEFWRFPDKWPWSQRQSCSVDGRGRDSHQVRKTSTAMFYNWAARTRPQGRYRNVAKGRYWQHRLGDTTSQNCQRYFISFRKHLVYLIPHLPKLFVFYSVDHAVFRLLIILESKELRKNWSTYLLMAAKHLDEEPGRRSWSAWAISI